MWSCVIKPDVFLNHTYFNGLVGKRKVVLKKSNPRLMHKSKLNPRIVGEYSSINLISLSQFLTIRCFNVYFLITVLNWFNRSTKTHPGPVVHLSDSPRDEGKVSITIPLFLHLFLLFLNESISYYYLITKHL